jgi:AcrR family transcriptional regulator
MSQPGYTRLDVDERRRQLLALGVELFTKHAYDELSMADIARAAGISKALLYHYFPSKSDYFQATLAQGAGELAARLEADPEMPPTRQWIFRMETYLAWIEENAAAYAKLMQSAGSVPEVRALIDGIRGSTVEGIMDVLGPKPEAAARTRSAVMGWLWFMDGVCLDWVARRDYDRSELRDLLLGALAGALEAAGTTPPPEILDARQ